MNERLGNRINFGIDLISFLIVCFVLTNFSKADPGDAIFVFVFESTIMLLSFSVFYIIFNTAKLTYLKRNESRKILLIQHFFKDLFTSIVTIIGILIGSFLVVLLLNQLTVELLVAFLKDNAFRFQSIEILNTSGVYLESETIARLENLFGKNYMICFWFIGIKYFVNLLINFFTKRSNSETGIFHFTGLIETMSQIIISPIAMLISCIILVILASIFGAQTWIIFVTLGVFRLIFMLFFAKLNPVLKTL